MVPHRDIPSDTETISSTSLSTLLNKPMPGHTLFSAEQNGIPSSRSPDAGKSSFATQIRPLPPATRSPSTQGAEFEEFSCRPCGQSESGNGERNSVGKIPTRPVLELNNLPPSSSQCSSLASSASVISSASTAPRSPTSSKNSAFSSSFSSTVYNSAFDRAVSTGAVVYSSEAHMTKAAFLPRAPSLQRSSKKSLSMPAGIGNLTPLPSKLAAEILAKDSDSANVEQAAGEESGKPDSPVTEERAAKEEADSTQQAKSRSHPSIRTMLASGNYHGSAVQIIAAACESNEEVRKQQLYDLWAPTKKQKSLSSFPMRKTPSLMLLFKQKKDVSSGSPTAPFLKSGWIEAKARSFFVSKWEMRFCELSIEGNLNVKKSETSEPLEIISLRGMTLKSDEKDLSIIHLIPVKGGSNLNFRISNFKNRKEWMESLRPWTKPSELSRSNEMDDMRSKFKERGRCCSAQKRSISMDFMMLRRAMSSLKKDSQLLKE
eukprot:758375-Hanusia_phi.AAC.1